MSKIARVKFIRDKEPNIKALTAKSKVLDGALYVATDTGTMWMGTSATSLIQIKDNINTNTTYTLTKSGSTITLKGSDGSSVNITDSNTIYNNATASAAGLMSAADKSKLDSVATGANKTIVDTSFVANSTNPVQSKVVKSALDGKSDTGHTHDDRYYTESEINTKLNAKANSSHTHTKSQITDFPTSMPASDVYSWAKQSSKPSYTISEVSGNLPASRISGIIAAANLPSYVDDVLEYASFSNFPTEGESGKIYTALDTNKIYRWSGSAYVVISETIALGTTHSSAGYGDESRAAYNHSTSTGNPHKTTKTDLGLGNVENKSSATIRGELTSANVTTALGYTPPKTDTNTHYTTRIVAGAANGTANAATTNGNTHINVTDNNTFRSGVVIKGTGATSVTSDESGNITVHSTDTDTWRPIQNNLTSTATDQSLSAAQGKALNDKFSSYVPTSRTVNGKALSANITLSAGDIGAAPSSHSHNYAGSSSAGGAATSAVKLVTGRTIGVGGAVTSTPTTFNGESNITIPINSVKESYLDWGGKSLSGNVSPIGMSLSSEHSANRLAFINGKALTMEYSSDGGSTYKDYGYSEADKSAFCTMTKNVPIGRTSGAYTTKSRTRITLFAQPYVYTNSKKMLIKVASSGGMNVLIEYKTGETGAAWKTYGTYALSGWSSWNDIPLILSTLGGGNDQTSNVWYLRMTFIMTSVSSSVNTRASVLGIRLFGTNDLSSASDGNHKGPMSSTGHLYSYDINANATFPADVKAPSFTGSLNGNAKTATTASSVAWSNVSSKPSFATVATSGSYNDLSNKPTIPTVPSSLKNPNALTISLNGTSQGAYDGSAVKNINITASSVGAAASSHTHTKSQITDFPTSMPASDVYAWAKASSKPSYSWSEISNKPTIPSVGNGTITITQNGATKGSFTLNQSGNATIALTDNDTKYSLPAATSSTLGGVKVGSNITNRSGTISLTKANVTAALGYTPPTSDTNTWRPEEVIISSTQPSASTCKLWIKI